LEPLLSAIEDLSERIAEYNDQIETLAQQAYPQVALLKQVKGLGTLIALTFLLTLEDPHRFRESRRGCHLGLQPGRRNSGQSEPQEAGGVAAPPVGEWRSVRPIAQQLPGRPVGGSSEKHSAKKERPSPTPSSGDCDKRLAQLLSYEEKRRSIIRWRHRLKRERPTGTERRVAP
jgi:hypothetical protein